jgi:hypothetical protein
MKQPLTVPPVVAIIKDNAALRAFARPLADAHTHVALAFDAGVDHNG